MTSVGPNDRLMSTSPERKARGSSLGLGWTLEVSHVGKPLAVQEFLRHILWREAGDRNLGYRRRGILQQIFHPGRSTRSCPTGFRICAVSAETLTSLFIC